MNINYYSNSETASISKLSASKSMIKFSSFFRFVFRILLAIIITATAVSCDKSQDKDRTRGVGVEEESISPAEFGNYHALVIGINNYKKWPNLKFAEKDADDIQKILISQYSFPKKNVTFLSNKDATREGILKVLRLKLGGLGEKDNLLIFYAGHGQLDSLTGNGYWIPADADLSQTYSWISSSTLQDLLVGPGVKAKSIIVVADACFAGGLLKRAGPSSSELFESTGSTRGQMSADNDVYKRYQHSLVKKANKKSRQVMLSGGYEVVPDISYFAAEFKHALKNNPYPYIDMEFLFFKEIFPDVKMIGQQDPAFARLKTGPELDGQFILVKKSDARTRTVVPIDEPVTPASETVTTPTPEPISPTPAPIPKKTILTVRSNVAGDTVFINDKNKGSTRLDIELEPGNYSLRVEKKGYKTHRENIKLAKGDNTVIRVNLLPDLASLPIIEFYEIKPSDVEVGQGATLTWRTKNATSVSINGLGNVALSGSEFIKPSKTQSYKIIAINDGGDNDASNDMQVMTEAVMNVRSAVALPVITSFSANPKTMLKGRSTLLSWQTSNADKVEIKDVGQFASDGIKRVRPSETRSYTLIATNKQGKSVEQSININVKSIKPPVIPKPPVVLEPPLIPKPPVIKVIAKPQLVTQGAKSSYMAKGKRRIKYSLAIKNWRVYPADLFKAAPDLPPCGKNNKASRTWVTIYDARRRKRLQGYCAFTSPNGLKRISFSIPSGVKPPEKVLVVLHDRKTGKKYSSNAVSPR